MKKRIRVAILSNNTVFLNWQHSTLVEIHNSNFADLVLNITIGSNTNKKPPFAWRSFSRVDTFLFKPSPNALAQIEGISLFQKVLRVPIVGSIDIKELKDYHLDVLINFSNDAPTQEIIASFKYGIWKLAQFDSKNTKEGPPGIWELIQGRPEIGGHLSYFAEGMTQPKILDSTSVCTDWISYSRNANIILWQAASLINRNLKRLYKHGETKILSGKLPVHPITKDPPPPLFKYPGAGLIIWHSIKTIFKKIGQLLENQFYFNQWILLFNNSQENSKYDLSRYMRIIPPKDRFWADPFLIKRNGKYYLFIEELIYKNKLGHLAVMELDEKGNYTPPKIILKKDYHLSYPFLIEDQGNLYMIPETGSNKNIQLYKCTNFPYEWKLEKILMENVVAVDTTIYKKDDRFWMFTNLREHKGMSSNVELFLFSSKELTSDQWTSHPLNPIVTDVKKSRPAGNIFIDGENIMRPSQNCSHHYGYGMNINKITKLDTANFEEEIEYSINPKWSKDVLCTHTFNSYDTLIISDAQIRRRRF